MITESEFIAATDRTLAAVGAALDTALATSDADVDWSFNDGFSRSIAPMEASSS